MTRSDEVRLTPSYQRVPEKNIQRFRFTSGCAASLTQPKREKESIMTDASTYVAALAESLKLRAIPISPNLKARYGKEFKSAVTKGVEEETLYAAIERIADRWDEHQLTVSQAMRDVHRGKPSRAESLSPGQRMAGYEYLFNLSARQQRIMERISQIGKETALAGLRGETSEQTKRGAA